MKSIALNIRGLVSLLVSILSIQAFASSWDFSTLSDNDRTNLNADLSSWSFDSAKNRWGNLNTISNAPLTANGHELAFAKGLLFTATAADEIRIDPQTKCLTLNKSTARVTIPKLTAGHTVSIVTKCSSKDVARTLEVANLTIVSGFEPSKSGDGNKTRIATVISDGDVTFNATGGMYIYSITVSDGNGGNDNPGSETSDHSVKMNPLANQMLLRTTGGDLKYYNTSDLSEVDIDKTTGTVTVTPKEGDWSDVFQKNISAINFAKAPTSGSEGEITNRGVNITEAKGWLESCYAKWDILEGASSYRVYIKGGKYIEYTPIDRELVRNYGTYGRADMVGLPQGSYTMRIVPVINGIENIEQASEASNLDVRPYDRSGFAFHNYSGIGAYKDNGELKDDADVIYVTAETAKTVKCTIFYDKAEKEFTGLQAILDALQKGTAKRPIAIRIIGCIKDSDMDGFSSKAEGIQIKGRNNYSPINVTIEGIGDDATTWGFGFLIRNCSSVEFRNFANMLCMDDALSFDTANSHCWIHHMDFFYGNTGGDSDQAKGDGTVDLKGHSRYMTIAYNRFWDCGKTSLCGMKSESEEDYVDYHHNWFDHSDSRHPRVRTMTVHVWNNYYDGVAKYGVGATMGSSILVENNFYRHTKDPMMISMQGTDAKGSGTFSGENGGMVKSFGNVYAEKGSSSNYTVITHHSSPTDFDCYEASSRDEKVPSDYVTKAGATAYNNFDTHPELMHSYKPSDATEIPSIVCGYYGAGRLNKGDFKWDFDYRDADTDYNVIKELKTALQAYKSELIGIFE